MERLPEDTATDATKAAECELTLNIRVLFFDVLPSYSTLRYTKN